MMIVEPCRRRGAGLSAAVTAAALLLTACGSSSTGAGDSADSTTSQFGLRPVESIANLVPENFKAKDGIPNAIYNDAPPQMFLEGDKLVGVQPDFAEAVGEVLGVKFDNMAIGNFDTLIPGLQSGRYDVAFADFGVTKEREQAVDFVYQFDLGTSFAVRKGSDKKIEDADDLCGLQVGAAAGSYFLTQVKTISDQCVAAGKQPTTTSGYPTQSSAILAVSNGRLDAYAASSDQLAFVAKQQGAGVVAEPFVYEPVPQGIGLPKGSPLGPAIRAAVRELISNGTYAKILDKWGISSAAITADQVVISPIPGAS